MNVLKLSSAIFKINCAAGSIAFRTAMTSHMLLIKTWLLSPVLIAHQVWTNISKGYPGIFWFSATISIHTYNLYTCITLSTNHGTACSPIFRMFFLSASSRTPWSGDGSVMPGNKSDTMPSNKGKSCDKNWKKNGKTR